MRYLFALLAILFSLQARAAFEEYDILDFESCGVFKIYDGFYPDLSSYKDEAEAFEILKNKMHEKYGEDGQIFNTGVVGPGSAHAICKGDYDWVAALLREDKNLVFQCKGDESFPIQSRAVFIFNGKKNRWAASCKKDCGKSKYQRLYWVDTEEGGKNKTKNIGYEKDRRALEKRCYRK